jgi:hypothetical protein
LLPEIASGAVLAGESVRVTGRVVAVDAFAGRLTLAHGGAEIMVDTTLAGPLATREGALFQFIGELAPGPAVGFVLLMDGGFCSSFLISAVTPVFFSEQL